MTTTRSYDVFEKISFGDYFDLFRSYRDAFRIASENRDFGPLEAIDQNWRGNWEKPEAVRCLAQEARNAASYGHNMMHISFFPSEKLVKSMVAGLQASDIGIFLCTDDRIPLTALEALHEAGYSYVGKGHFQADSGLLRGGCQPTVSNLSVDPEQEDDTEWFVRISVDSNFSEPFWSRGGRRIWGDKDRSEDLYLHEEDADAIRRICENHPYWQDNLIFCEGRLNRLHIQYEKGELTDEQ